jgi:3-isopropylmalate dehydrogenase
VPDVSAFEIAVLPGDGIGADVVSEAVRVLRAVELKLEGVCFQLSEHSVGAGEYLRSGDALPEEAFNACRKADAVLLGAMGLPSVRRPDGRELTPQIDLRERLDLYCGLRPVRLFHESDSPLKGFGAGEIDFLIVRENCEGLFSARWSQRDPSAASATDTLRITRAGAERIVQAACREALKRRCRLTLVDKANVLPSMVFFREVFDRVTAGYPQLETERVYVDAAALFMVKDPRRFDVIVTENMFGDILSDLAAGLVGGMGMAPSADIGEGHGVFQPSHGTAPDIAGKGIANPVATILSAAMMLEWLGHPQTVRGAELIRCAVAAALLDPNQRTPDMGGKLTTSQLTDRILAQIA